MAQHADGRELTQSQLPKSVCHGASQHMAPRAILTIERFGMIVIAIAGRTKWVQNDEDTF